jgi:excisionase family DNA binding protein
LIKEASWMNCPASNSEVGVISFNPNASPVVVNNHISVKAAAEFSGYSLQYLRRLLRSGKLEGVKIGQVWLIDKDTFEAYLKKANQSTDRRFGPQ